MLPAARRIRLTLARAFSLPACLCVWSRIQSLLAAGGLAGATGAWAATPADVVKTR